MVLHDGGDSRASFFREQRLSGASLASTSHFAFQLPGSDAVDIFVVWALIASAGLAKIGFGFWQLRRLRQSCAVMDSASLDPVLRNTLAEFGSSRPVTICTSERVRTPAAIGFLKPAIIFPPWTLQELSPAELNAVLLHELAHLRRWDDWTNLAQEIMRALFFFHPAFWWIGRGLALEREMACDDFVLAGNSNPRAYAQCLVSVAEKSFLRRGLALAQAVGDECNRPRNGSCEFSTPSVQPRPGFTGPALGLVAAFSAVCLIALPHAPRLVSFDGSDAGFSESASRGFATPALDSGQVAAKMIPAALHGRLHIPSAAIFRREQIPGHALQLASRSIYNRRPARNVASARLACASNQLFSHVDAMSAQHDRRKHDQRECELFQSCDIVSAPKAMLLVIQTEAVDSDGQVWSISIMRLTVFHPANRRIQKEIIPKTT